jgi:Protein of unknown function (DUF3800)
MPVQVFVDDSGSQGQGRHFALVGLGADSEAWERFSLEWRACLDAPPRVRLLKMRDAAGLGGEFNRWSEDMRDDKLRALARVINRHVKFVIWTVIDLQAHAKVWAHKPKPHGEVYFWPFHTVTMGVCFDLWERGWREPFEIVFDEQVIFGPRAKAWYLVVKEVVRLKEPDSHGIMPIEPVFRTDDDELPIQAADMYAWCIRRNTDQPDDQVFTWLLDELRNVSQSDYSNYYDQERMESVNVQADAIFKPRVFRMSCSTCTRRPLVPAEDVG